MCVIVSLIVCLFLKDPLSIVHNAWVLGTSGAPKIHTASLRSRCMKGSEDPGHWNSPSAPRDASNSLILTSFVDFEKHLQIFNVKLLSSVFSLF